MERMKNQDKIEELEGSNKMECQWKTKKTQRFLYFPVPGRSDACQEMNG